MKKNSKKSDKYRSRTLAFNILFSAHVGKLDLDQILRDVLNSEESNGIRSDITRRILIWKQRHEYIDKVISLRSSKGEPDQMASVALTALRLGICELEFMEDIPPEVAINEAVEITKTYGDPHLARFVNGVLDTHYKTLKSKGDEDGQGKEDETA